MKDEELRNFWKIANMESSKMKKISIRQSQFQQEMDHRERIVRSRDRREIMVAGLGIILYVGLSFYLPFSTTSLAALFCAASLLFIIYKLRTKRRSLYETPMHLPLLEQCLTQRNYMMEQHKLLSSVLYWYVLPFFVSYTVLVWTSSRLDESDFGIFAFLHVGRWEAKVVVTLIMMAVGIYIVRQNRRAARENWSPLIQKLDRFIADLNDRHEEEVAR